MEGAARTFLERSSHGLAKGHRGDRWDCGNSILRKRRWCCVLGPSHIVHQADGSDVILLNLFDLCDREAVKLVSFLQGERFAILTTREAGRGQVCDVGGCGVSQNV
eukprot:9203634-Pyramimonas_sp.AAC.1